MLPKKNFLLSQKPLFSQTSFRTLFRQLLSACVNQFGLLSISAGIFLDSLVFFSIFLDCSGIKKSLLYLPTAEILHLYFFLTKPAM